MQQSKQQPNNHFYIDKALLEASNAETAPDLFSEKDGLCFAGTHLVLDCWGATHLDDLKHIEASLKEAVKIAGATLLHIHLHHFTLNHGVSGVAVLAESHISIHTWPERGFAAIDIFMCGETRPEKTIAVFKAAFKVKNMTISKQLRGVIPESCETTKHESAKTEEILQC